MKNMKLSYGSLISPMLKILGGTYGSGAFLTDGTPIVVMNHNGMDVSHDGWLVKFIGGDNGFRNCVHPFERSQQSYAHGVYDRVRKLEASEMTPALQYFTGQPMKVKFSLTNPSSKVSAMLAKWRIDSGYERTCHSDTCSCMSHDSGYDWESFEVPMVVAEYLDKGNRINRHSGNVHSHGWCGWKSVPCERDLRNRSERAAESCKQIVRIAKETVGTIRQLRLVNKESMISAIWDLAGAACVENIEESQQWKACSQLTQSSVEFQELLEKQIVADRIKQRDSFLAPSHWAGLNQLSIA